MSDESSDKKKCKLLLDVPGIAPGWGCCSCKVYNNIQRPQCKVCSHERCVDVNIVVIDPPDLKDLSKWN